MKRALLVKERGIRNSDSFKTYPDLESVIKI